MSDEAAEQLDALPAFEEGVFSCLFRGDLELPDGSSVYALFRERQASVIAASDLLS